MAEAEIKHDHSPAPVLTPFDVLRNTHDLAPQDPELNERRWRAGVALRELFKVADKLRPCSHSWVRDEIFRDVYGCELNAGPAAWSIIKLVVIDGESVNVCRGFVAEEPTPWRADIIVMDRLRVALDRIASHWTASIRF